MDVVQLHHNIDINGPRVHSTRQILCQSVSFSSGLHLEKLIVFFFYKVFLGQEVKILTLVIDLEERLLFNGIHSSENDPLNNIKIGGNSLCPAIVFMLRHFHIGQAVLFTVKSADLFQQRIIY